MTIRSPGAPRPTGPIPPSPVSAPIARALRLMEGRFADPLTLRELARVADMNVSTMIKRFRQELGVTPHRHLCRMRVQAAQALLESGLKPALAAIEAGFFDQSHLARHFKRHCGTTPGRYAAAVALAAAAA